ncbi:hypothetical protein [Microbispora sp. KK1-11]|uniref:hypothetical protein n=1 Tax=Microbispora sp. KK1-11 TaxID=2053005 RepID=UPI00115A05EC|nr:hypothetical protein [Microbispora sp. KK1-11]TQS30548.1 hypothetical protein FLW16_04690 [Microbispora sp. KK1-11]
MRTTASPRRRRPSRTATGATLSRTAAVGAASTWPRTPAAADRTSATQSAARITRIGSSRGS